MGMEGMDMGGSSSSSSNASLSASAEGMHMDHVHTCEGSFDPTKPYHYGHGAYLGHMLPGYFFLIWGTWWAINIFAQNCKANARRQPYEARTWFRWPGPPQWLARFPLEPILKIALPFIGINGELWAGHESWRTLYADTGAFNVDNLNDWQHSCMYFAFMASGIIDLIGTRRRLPPGTQRGFLALAFAVEGILLGFHLKGPEFEVIIHKLLVYTICGVVLFVLAEGALPSNPFVSLGRAALVILQGTWFMQIAVMMYNVPFRTEWHPCYMGSAMFAPVYYSMHLLVIFLVLTIGFVLSEVIYEKINPAAAAGPATPGPRYHKVGGGMMMGAAHSGDDHESARLADSIELAVPGSIGAKYDRD